MSITVTLDLVTVEIFPPSWETPQTNWVESLFPRGIFSPSLFPPVSCFWGIPMVSSSLRSPSWDLRRKEITSIGGAHLPWSQGMGPADGTQNRIETKLRIEDDKIEWLLMRLHLTDSCHCSDLYVQFCSVEIGMSAQFSS